MKDKFIKFDGIKYNIEEKDKSNDNNMGQVLYKKGIIEIDNSMPKDVKQITLMHECTHIILAHIGESELNNKEDFVERLGNAFYRLIKDNPILIEEVKGNT